VTDGREEQSSEPGQDPGEALPAAPGEDSREETREPPLPEIDPALVRAVEEAGEETPSEAPARPEPDGAWAQVAEVLEAVPEEGESAPVAQEVAPAAGEDDDEGASGAVAEPELSEEDEEALAELRAIPLRQRVEAILFAASEPVSLARLRTLTAAEDPLGLRRVLDGLAAEYEQEGRAFTFHELAGGIQLRTRPEMAPVVARLGRRRETERLSPAALETLAIVAYRQPVLRVDVEKIRGVASGEVLRTLVERGFVRVAGRAELPGSPLLYGTTARFLEVFGLRNLRDLPSDDQLLQRPT